MNPAADDDALERAKRAHARLFARMTWWDHWRTRLMLPLILAGGGAGWFVGHAIQRGFALPDKTEFIVAVLGLVVMGRLINVFFDVRKLEMARRRADGLARKKGPK